MISDELEVFVSRLPMISEFGDVADASGYLALPDGWLVGTSDVVYSTGAIEAGRYKSVNMVGASVIAAVRNTLATPLVPFVFGGDGATFVIPPAARAPVAEALGAVATWSQEEIGLSLRTALIPVEDIRAAGLDVRVAQFQVSPEISFAMFAGGRVAWADGKMKDGTYAIPAAPAGSRPDLTGLSCRWQPIRPQRGMIASMLVLRQDHAAMGTYRELVRTIVDYIHQREIEEGRPVSFETAKFALSARAIDLEMRALGGSGSLIWRWLKLIGFYVMVQGLFLFGIRLGKFSPEKYRRETVRNTDFRKFDDGLKLTIDCSQQTYDGLGKILADAHAAGISDYGLHAQKTALMTCIVPSPTEATHIHFVDGAGGGYAKAAEMLKAQRVTAG